MSEAEFRGGDVNAILRLVKSLSDNGDAQLTMLTMALAVACWSCGVSKDNALQVISDCFDDERRLVPLETQFS